MPKQYCGNGKIIETKFGEIIKLSLTQDDLAILQANLDNGWVNLNVMERQSPSKGGMTHYICIDDWKPNQAEKPVAETVDDELPF